VCRKLNWFSYVFQQHISCTRTCIFTHLCTKIRSEHHNSTSAHISEDNQSMWLCDKTDIPSRQLTATSDFQFQAELVFVQKRKQTWTKTEQTTLHCTPHFQSTYKHQTLVALHLYAINMTRQWHFWKFSYHTTCPTNHTCLKMITAINYFTSISMQ